VRAWMVCGLGIAAIALAAAYGSAPSKAADQSVNVDIELAFDTTESMAPVLQNARQDAQRVIEGVRAVVPEVRFGVVSFRDPGNPGGEYETLQKLTSDTSLVEAAIGRLVDHPNPSPSNLLTESYNLAFHRSYADNALGWRPSSRKIVIVIGDAQGYGGGTAGIPGCGDTHADPDGFDVKKELAGMRAAHRTLVMIRERSPQLSVSLACYRSLVAQTYPGGAARDGNAVDLVTPLVALVRGAVAPITITPAFPFAMPGSTTGFLVKVFNPNEFAVSANILTVRVPAGSGFRKITALPKPSGAHNGVLTWTIGKMLSPHSALRFRVTMQAPNTERRATVRVAGTFQLADGAEFTSDSSFTLHVTRQILIRTNGSAGGHSISGVIRASFGKQQSPIKAVIPVHDGLLTVRSGGRKTTIRPDRIVLSLRPGDAEAALSVHVATSGIVGCAAGTRGTLRIVDHAFGSIAGSATAHIVLPHRCGGSITWPFHAASIGPVP
jgi:hypothetical protein